MNYHDYYLTLERKFSVIAQYIYIHKDNFGTYSTELAMLYMASSSEFEIVSKELCAIFEPSIHPYNMKEIHQILRTNVPLLFVEKVSILNTDKEISPLGDWPTDRPIEWWKDYNDVKHNRFKDFNKATLINAINSLSSLLVVNHYLLWYQYFKDQDKRSAIKMMSSLPEVFRIVDLKYQSTLLAID